MKIQSIRREVYDGLVVSRAICFDDSTNLTLLFVKITIKITFF